jgi:uncharacterized SAM-binding protein YcdF (DUF218 family)
MIGYIFSVSGLVLALLTVAICWHLRLSRRGARLTLLAVVAIYLLASLYSISYGIGQLLVGEYRPLRASDLAPGRVAIVLLGVGESAVRDWDGNSATLFTAVSGSRVLEAARVYRLSSDAWVISSGGPVSREPGAPTSAALMQEALTRLGVPASRIVLEAQSRTTRDEAVLVAPMLRALNVDQVVLVTSATHLRRAMGAFRATGANPIPSMARDPNLPFEWRRWLLPTNRSLEHTASVVHEVVGLAYYRLKGWLR